MTIGKDLTKNVADNERETTGQNRTIFVGQNRSADIGLVDSTSVGEKFFVQIKPPEGEGGAGAGGGSPTSATMIDKKIVFTTGAGATITMEGAKVTIEADTIELFAKKNIQANAESQDVSIHAKTDIALASDQTLHASTKGGVIDVAAAGGNILLTTDQSVGIMATTSFETASSIASISASAVATVSGTQQAALVSNVAIVSGAVEAVVTGAIVAISGGATSVASGGELLITGALVNINP